MASPLCKLTVSKVYQEVIDDVINNARELFLEEGVDLQILQELKQHWETKLLATEAFKNELVYNSGVEKVNKVVCGATKFLKPQQPTQKLKQVVGQVAPNNRVQTPIAHVDKNKMVPIQISFPPQLGTNGVKRVLTIQVPASTLKENQLHKMLTGPVIQATMSLPEHMAAAVLQQHVNAVLNSQQQNLTLGPSVNKSVIQQCDGSVDMDENASASYSDSSTSTLFTIESIKTKKCKANSKKQKIPIKLQVDGIDDNTSDDDEEDGCDDEYDSSEIYFDDEQETEEGGLEEEALNSGDDTEELSVDLFDTDNVIVCQYEKIIRKRNIWKFHLSNGIMHLDGEDYVFQKTSGDAEW